MSAPGLNGQPDFGEVAEEYGFDTAADWITAQTELDGDGEESYTFDEYLEDATDSSWDEGWSDDSGSDNDD